MGNEPIAKVALLVPTLTVTDCGTVTRDAEPEILTTKPLAGALVFKVTVPEAALGATTELGLRKIPDR